MRSHTTGIAWYERSQYRLLAEHMTDAAAFPAQYDAWLQPARALYAAFEQEGRRVVRVYLDELQFFTWCAHLGAAPDAAARRAFVRWYLDGCKALAGGRRPSPAAANVVTGGGAWTWASSTPQGAAIDLRGERRWPGLTPVRRSSQSALRR